MSLSGQQQRRQQVFSGQSQRYDYVRSSVHHRLDIDDARTRAPSPFLLPRRDAVLKLAHTRLPSVGFRSRSRFFAVSLQVT